VFGHRGIINNDCNC